MLLTAVHSLKMEVSILWIVFEWGTNYLCSYPIIPLEQSLSHPPELLKLTKKEKGSNCRKKGKERKGEAEAEAEAEAEGRGECQLC